MSQSRSSVDRRQPGSAGSSGVPDLVLYALFALQWTNLFLAERLIAGTGLFSLQTPAAVLHLVISSGLCGAIASHELIHRRAAHQRWMGRLLLCTVLYEHFYTEHLRGHHARVGRRDDPTTARLGESFWAYFARAVPGQLSSAWRLEERRLKARPGLSLLSNRVLQGLVLETALAAGLLLLFGWRGLLLFLFQAAAVTIFAQAVSYFEHWGLERAGAAVEASHSWDATDRSSLFGMVGLARHADHHLHPTRSYHRLRYQAESPKLPRGYGIMILLALFRNRECRRLMADELRRRRLRSASPGRDGGAARRAHEESAPTTT